MEVKQPELKLVLLRGVIVAVEGLTAGPQHCPLHFSFSARSHLRTVWPVQLPILAKVCFIDMRLSLLDCMSYV